MSCLSRTREGSIHIAHSLLHTHSVAHGSVHSSSKIRGMRVNMHTCGLCRSTDLGTVYIVTVVDVNYQAIPTSTSLHFCIKIHSRYNYTIMSQCYIGIIKAVVNNAKGTV